MPASWARVCHGGKKWPGASRYGKDVSAGGNEPALQHEFDGLYLIDTAGQVLAEYPKAYEQTGLNVSHREYFTRVASQLTPVISEPYVSNYRNHPAVMIAAPVFNRPGPWQVSKGRYKLRAVPVRTVSYRFSKWPRCPGLWLRSGQHARLMHPSPVRAITSSGFCLRSFCL